MRRMIGFLMMVGLVVGVVGCGNDDSSPTSSSVSQNEYSGTIVGTWKYDGEAFWTFSADGTTLFIDYGTTYYWEISGSTLTITNMDGSLWGDHPFEIQSMSDTKLVYIEKIDKVDGSGTIDEKYTFTR